MTQIKVNTHYPYSDKYVYETYMEIINLDEERVRDVTEGNGFIVSAPKAIKDDIKDPNGIFSEKFGSTLQDDRPYENRYRCRCGYKMGKLYNHEICDVCGQPVKFVDDNFTYFGWLVLKDPYHIIHPNLFNNIASLIGNDAFDKIINYYDEKDEDGNDVPIVRSKDEPFYGIGLIDFYDRFDEIAEFYLQKRPEKKDQYDHLMANREKIFIQSIPVYTTHLRPFKLEAGDLHYEATNALYNMMTRHVANINDDKYKMSQKKKPKSQLLYNLQMKFMELDKELDQILAGKKGSKQTWSAKMKVLVENFLNCWKAKSRNRYANQQPSLI